MKNDVEIELPGLKSQVPKEIENKLVKFSVGKRETYS